MREPAATVREPAFTQLDLQAFDDPGIADEAVETAFRTAFQSIKPIDGVFVGMYPRRVDEIKMNAEIVHKILTAV